MNFPAEVVEDFCIQKAKFESVVNHSKFFGNGKIKLFENISLEIDITLDNSTGLLGFPVHERELSVEEYVFLLRHY